MLILAIDTSCDDTSAAVLNNDKILSNVVSSQEDLHKKWGGVVPDLAKRAHQQRIEPVIEKALKRARKTMSEVEIIAVTQGPGLAPALAVGVNKAKELAIKYDKKLIAVNHIEGHLLSNIAKNSQGKPERMIEFPALALTVSGGHTKLVLIKDIGNYEVVGETLDDAAGEALDKAAKLLGLGYPGGPVIERLALKGNINFWELPRPLEHQKNFDYSFSGLKTSFYYKVKDLDKKFIIDNLENLAATYQEAVFDSLIIKLEKAIEYYEPKMLLAAGGVMANETLRKKLRDIAKKHYLKIYMPAKRILNTDNAGMIGVAAYYKMLRSEFVERPEELDRNPRLEL